MTQAYDPKDCPMPLDFFLRRYGISRTTAWRWRKNGLPTLQVGAKIFCRESEFVRFMEVKPPSITMTRHTAFPYQTLIELTFRSRLFLSCDIRRYERI